MKFTFSAAVAGTLILTSPAQAARYLEFSVTGMYGTVRAVFDTQQTPPGMPLYTGSSAVSMTFSYTDTSFTWSKLFVGQLLYGPPYPGCPTCSTAYEDPGHPSVWFHGSVDFPAQDLTASNFFFETNPNLGYPFAWHETQIMGGTRYAYWDFGGDLITDLKIRGSDTPFHPISLLPESSTWAMMMVGLGAIGGIARRARRRGNQKAIAQV